MSKYHIAVCALLIAGGVVMSNVSTSSAGDTLTPSKLGLTYVIHLPERQDIFWNNSQAVSDYMGKLSQLVTGMVGKGAAVDVQTDYNAIDKGYGGLLSDLAGLGDQVAVDVHTHKDDKVNNADVAYMLQQLGLADTGVVGGYLNDQGQPTTETGVSTGYLWDPSILWGEGTFLHTADVPSTGFRTEGDMTHIGGAATGPSALDSLIGMVQSDPYGQLLNDSFFIGGPRLNVQGILDSIDGINQKVGDVGYWATLPQLANDWVNVYNSNPSFRNF